MNIIVKVEGRALFPSDMVLGNRGDNDITALQFMVPQIFGVQSAYAVYKRADTVTDTALLDAEGLWPIDRAITGTPGELDVFLRVVSGESDEVWNSNKVRFLIRPLFEITDNTIADDPDELERALGIIGAYAADAGAGAQIAETSAQSAQDSAAAALASQQEAGTSAGSAAVSAQNAQDSAGAAYASAQAADESEEQAGVYARQAQDSAQAAAGSAASLVFPPVETETLQPGSNATAQWKEGPVLHIGIPRGYDGQGSGDMMASTYDRDGDGVVDKAASLTGSIEMGQVTGLESALAGKVDNSALNAVEEALADKADGSALLAVDQRLTGHIDDKANPHQVTAQQAGARPDTWMPTLTELGITAGTTELTAGTSPLANGEVYLMYE